MEEDLLFAKGMVRDIKVIDRKPKDNLVKFKLEDHPQEFSLFGDFKYKVGDYIEFDYTIKDDMYYNVKSMRDHRILNEEPITTEELEKVTEQVNYKNNKPLAMELAFKYGIIRNYEVEEIYVLYNKILEKIEWEN